LTRPVNGLVEQVDRIAQGEYGLQIKAPTQVELARLTDAINHMSQSLHESFELEKRMHRSEKLALLGELAAGSAHEIRNPLAVIHGFMHLLEKELPERHKQRYHVPLIMQELVRINHIVEDMLMLARPGAPDIERGSLHTILEEIIPLIEQNAPPGIRFEWDVHENKLCMDGQQMKQVFHNLLRNSMEALEEEGTIRVYTRLDEQRMHIFVEDNGPGIPEELRESIFDPFISSKKTGTGLGLTIIQRIIENHKGTVCIASTGEQGTTFQLTLRLFRPVTEE
jgi:two-component system, NtrC family, sensor histidine kinase AtoS